MNKIVRTSLSLILIIGAIALLIFALPLLSPLSIANMGAFLLLLAIGLLVGWSGIEIAQGENPREVLADLFRMLGR